MTEKFKIILASKSQYRAQQLTNLKLDFRQISPEIDENSYKNDIKNPIELALKLSEVKAFSVAEKIKTSSEFQPDINYLIIGSDQVVNIDNKILNKPATVENAANQLKKLSGRQHLLITALTLLKISAESTEKLQGSVTQQMQMYSLTDGQIRNYIQMDNPIYCAGSYMIEGVGITLFEKITGEDFTSITGLPLLKLIKFMKNFGFCFV